MAIKYVMKQIKSIVFVQSKAFTLIEMMINLSIVIIIMSLLPLIYVNIFQLSGKSTDHFDVNNAMFQRELYEELTDANYVDIIENQLYIHHGNDVIRYYFHNQRIVRQLNGKGYIIMLEGVKNAIFKEGAQGVSLTIERHHKKNVTYKII